RSAFPLAKNSRSLWASATLRTEWLGTVDLRPHLDTLKRHTLDDADRAQAGARLRATKALQAAAVRLDKDNSKQNAKVYIDALCTEVLAKHDPAAQTLVILNNVGRAQQLFL